MTPAKVDGRQPAGADSGPLTDGAPVHVWAPLTVPIYRALWLTALVSNIGTWMQTVGAQWFLVEQHTSPLLIALIQTASAAPVLLFGIPAGVLGELLNRRWLLIWMQALQVVISGALVWLTISGQLTSYLLLGITFLLGAATAVQLPAYQALATEIVPRPMIPMAASLSAISINTARAIGPAIAGVLLSAYGVGFVFAVNVASYAAFLLVLIFWRKYVPSPHEPEHFTDAARAGIRYVSNSAVVKRIYVRLGLFVVPGSVLYALLPLIATDRLGLDSVGYGLLLAGLGAGSIAAAFLVSWFHRVGVNRTVFSCSALFGLATVGVAVSPSILLTLPLLAVAGASWIGVVATLNGTVQTFLPVWVRSRGLSIYQMVLYGSMAAGGLVSGVVAGWMGAVVTCAIAGAVTVVAATTHLIWPLVDSTDMRRTSVALPLKTADADAHIDGDGATLVTVRWTVNEKDRAAFIAHASLVERSRRRTGARTWGLYEDREYEQVLVEVFAVGSWQEHLQQHRTRLTPYDQEVLHGADALAQTVDVQHLIQLPNPVTPHGRQEKKR